MKKTLKQFEAENMNEYFGHGLVCNRVFSFKPWFNTDKEGKDSYNRQLTHNGKTITVFVAAEYSQGYGWECCYAEVKETGEEFEAICTYGRSKEDLMNQIMGC